MAETLKKANEWRDIWAMNRLPPAITVLLVFDEEKNLLLVKGAVAGPAGGYVLVRTSKTKQ